MDLMFETCYEWLKAGKEREFVTGNNDADAVYFLHWVIKHFPAKAGHIKAKLEQWGGNASGVNVANIDNLGNVHPDTFFSRSRALRGNAVIPRQRYKARRVGTRKISLP